MIIDTHTHFYDPQRPQGVPWPPRENQLLYRTVMPDDAKAVSQPHGVTGTIVVEASPWVEDNQWILDLAEEEPFILGLIGHLIPDSPDFATNLRRFADHPRFLGIRLGPGRTDDCDEATLHGALKSLEEHDLTLELMSYPERLEADLRVPRNFPGLRIVLDHVAHVAMTGEAPDPQWVAGMQAMAEHPNVYCKVSGMVERAATKPAPEDPAFYVPTLDVLWNAFGPDRLIYGSNWPVCAMAAPYETVFRIVQSFFSKKPDGTTEKVFAENSREAYRWTER